jgi:amino acid adenylation domain-containing protein/thioester reductase-like protein
MTRKEILTAYKEGKLSANEVKEKLCKLQQFKKNSLSEGQKGLWMLQKMSPDMSAYNIPICFWMYHKLDLENFKEAFRLVLAKYPILTSVFEVDAGVPYQIVQPTQPLAIQQEDISAFEPQEIRQYLRKKTKEPFSLERGPLMRIYILKRSAEEYMILITVHHIIFDGSSSLLFITNLLDVYKDLIQGKKPSAVPPSTTFNDYVEWEQKMLVSKEGEGLRSYWKQNLSGTLPVLELCTDRPRFSSLDSKGETYTNLLSSKLTRQIKGFAKDHYVNLSIVLLGVFKVLLYRYTGQNDIIVGMPTIVRPQERFDSLIGYFINMIPVRSKVEEEQSFSQFIRQLQLTVIDGLDHASYPFSVLVRELKVLRTKFNSPVFQVAFAYQNFFQSTTIKSIENQYQFTLPIEFVKEIHQEGEHELALEVLEQEDGIVLSLKYNPDLFDSLTIKHMLENYINLLEKVVNNPNLTVDDYSLLSEAEQQRLLVSCNETQIEYPKDKCVHELFEIQARKTPDALAVVYEEESLTYMELNEKSTLLAIYLQQQGVTPECLVGICAERSLSMIIGILGIIKAGGAYVPLDPEYPAERLEYMIQDSKIALILTQSRLIDKISKLAGNGVKTVAIDTDWDEIQEGKAEKTLKREVQPGHLAYVLYTSGSTGNPKGVMIPHKALVNFLIAMGNRPGLNSQDKLLAVTTYCFDIAGLEIYLPLINGAQCYICSAEKTKDAERLKQEIRRVKPTIMQATPVTWTMLFQVGWKNEENTKILCGGEALSEQLKQYFMDTNSDVWNMFGPTETTIWSTVQHIKREEPITIGKPIANTQIYILDKKLKPVPIGVSGELYIAGDGLAKGYLNKPELTAEKFINNPFNCGTKIYKTGDLARWLSNGNIEFLGRNDYQVKIRGFRIELGEIEAVLVKFPQVQESVVIAREVIPGDKRLIAYIVAREKEHCKINELRSYLSEKLPEYMIPTSFVFMESFPLTPNAKIDRKALPMPVRLKSETEKAYVVPGTSTEEIIADVWGKVLGIEQVGKLDNFFELGGHSLLATQVISRLRDVFNVEVSLSSMFDKPTVVGMAESIEAIRLRERSVQVPSIKPVCRDNEIPLSFAQQRLWILDKLQPDSSSYNIPMGLLLKGSFNIKLFEKSLNEVVHRHESLRTIFTSVEGKQQQLIIPEMVIPIVIEDLSELTEAEPKSEVLRRAKKEAQRMFDLSKGPLIRANLWKLGEDEHVLLITMHHIISDGWSIGVMIREITTLYEAFSVGQLSRLSDLAIQYADFAVWQRECLQGKELQRQLSYWKEHLRGELPVLELPLDQPRPPVQTFRGAMQSFVLSKEITKGLRALSRREDVTLFMTLLAGYQVLLSRYTGQEDIIVGSPIANRNHAEIEELIGLFVNTLVLRTDLSGNPAFTEVLARVKKTTLGAYAHQDLPFERLVEQLQPVRDMSQSPLFQVMFILQNAPMPSLELSKLTLSPVIIDGGTSKFDLTLSMSEEEHELVGVIEYNTDLFEASTIKRMIEHYTALIEGIITDPSQNICTLPILAEEEQQRLLVSCNETQIEYPKDKCVHELFEIQARKTPDALAVVYEEESLTYMELNEKSTLLAIYLQQQGVTPECLVGICAERSLSMIIGILGIIKAGGAYVPLDPEYPAERLEYMIQDSKIALILTQSRLIDKISKLAGNGVKTVAIDTDWDEIQEGKAEKTLKREVQPGHLAYVLYTSGSTGNPKGVMIPHKALVNFLIAMGNRPGLNSQDKLLAVTTYCFDIAGLEIYLPLINGAQCYICSAEKTKDAERLKQEIRRVKPTIMQATPVTWTMLFQVGWKNEENTKILCGGEALSEQLKQYFMDTNSDVWNMFGPTETTIWSTVQHIKREEPITIGKPIANTQIYILDKKLKPVPIGVSGELYIAGDGLAKGYLNKPELTAEKFINNPFNCGTKIYKTGDLARWLSNGNIEFLGRNDYQVKIRGFRIELGEIESRLLQYEDVRGTIVVDREDENAKKYICAYYISSQYISVTELRKYLAKYLPNYMIPSYFIRIDEFPLTPNGKIDRKLLPEPREQVKIEAEFVPPSNEVEVQMVEIWLELLKIPILGVNDNLFNMGADSLNIIEFLTFTLSHDWGLKVQDIYSNPTVKGLAKLITEELQGKDETKVAGKSQEITKAHQVVEVHINNDQPEIAHRPKKHSLDSVDFNKKNQFKNVLLTGAAGFLGAHILEALLHNTTAKIYCLIRGRDNEEIDYRIIETLQFYFNGVYSGLIGERIILVNGDISVERLGLSETYYNQLSCTIDTVINAAALVKHYGEYADFEKINVSGTGNLIAFCRTNHIKFNHISTVSVSGNHLLEETAGSCIFTENDFYIGQSYKDNVYIRSKFEAENLIFKAMNDGLNATIFRVGNLTGRYRDGQFQKNIEDNAFYKRIKSIFELGVIPEQIASQEVEYTPIDYCGLAIVKLALMQASSGEIYHVFNHNKIELNEILKLGKDIGYSARVLNQQDFQAYAKRISKDPTQRGALAGLITDFRRDNKLSFATEIEIDSMITRTCLSKLGFSWPTIGIEYLLKLTEYMRKVQFINDIIVLKNDETL